ncbi:MAG: hypothetical protein HY819_07885 [Acidobacteria bacterium]|nr:hypothetical protein [Acidobacteriota bacterium]
MNSVQQRFLIFCFFVALIIGGIGIFISKTLTSEPGKVDLAGKSKNIQAERAATLEERLGVDDNASIAFIYGADMQGSLEQCGCKLNPQGGLARRAKYTEAFKEKYKDNIPFLNVDIGHLFTEDLAFNKPETLREDAILMNQWMLKAFSQFKLDAVNFSHRDLLYGKTILDKEKYDNQIKETPILEEFISSNISISTDSKITSLNPYLIREINGKRFGNKPSIKVGFIGVTEPWPGGTTGFVIDNPAEKVKVVLPEVRSKADIVVVLAYATLGTAREIIKQNPDIDVLIAANSVSAPPPAQREGKTVLVYAMHQTKNLGELRLYLDGEGKIKDYLNRYIPLDKNIPDQIDAAKIVATAKVEIDMTKTKVAEEEGLEVPENNPTGQNIGQPALTVKTTKESSKETKTR